MLLADMQLVKQGGENALHSHTQSDGFFIVLEGAVKFYGESDVLLAELGKQEGIVIPHGFKYLFESESVTCKFPYHHYCIWTTYRTQSFNNCKSY